MIVNTTKLKEYISKSTRRTQIGNDSLHYIEEVIDSLVATIINIDNINSFDDGKSRLTDKLVCDALTSVANDYDKVCRVFDVIPEIGDYDRPEGKEEHSTASNVPEVILNKSDTKEVVIRLKLG